MQRTCPQNSHYILCWVVNTKNRHVGVNGQTSTVGYCVLIYGNGHLSTLSMDVTLERSFLRGARCESSPASLRLVNSPWTSLRGIEAKHTLPLQFLTDNRTIQQIVQPNSFICYIHEFVSNSMTMWKVMRNLKQINLGAANNIPLKQTMSLVTIINR